MSDAGAPRLVLVTAPSEAVALDLARAVVGEGLAACVNVVPGLRSVYRWEGAVEEAPEVLLLLKTRLDRVDTLRDRVVAPTRTTCPSSSCFPWREASTRISRGSAPRPPRP